jgi:hypothetical protein
MKMIVSWNLITPQGETGFTNLSIGWRNPIQPIGAEDQGDEYDPLEAIQDEPVSSPLLIILS